MQEEWTDKLKTQLNHELELDGITADSDFIQKTLQRIEEAELSEEERSGDKRIFEVQVCSESKKKKEAYKKLKLFRRSFLAAAAVMLCLFVVKAMIPGMLQKNMDAELSDQSSQPAAGGNGETSITSGTGTMPDEAQSDMDGGSNQTDNESIQKNESQTEQEFSKDSNAGTAEESSGAEDTGSLKDCLVFLKHPDRIVVTVPDGHSLFFQTSEAAGVFLYALLKTAVPAQLAAEEGRCKTEFREESETLICRIQLLEGETEQQLLLYRGGFLTSQEQLENRLVWWIEGSEGIEEFLERDLEFEERDKKIEELKKPALY